MAQELCEGGELGAQQCLEKWLQNAESSKAGTFLKKNLDLKRLATGTEAM